MSLQRNIVPLLLSAVGFTLLALGWLSSGYWQSVLIEFGSTVLLLVPLFGAERLLERLATEVAGVEGRTAAVVEQQTSALRSELEGVRRDVAATNLRLDEIAEESTRRLRAAAQSTKDATARLGLSPSWNDLFDLMSEATRIDAISTSGVRAVLSGTGERMSIYQEFDEQSSEPQLVGLGWAIEHASGERLEAHAWSNDQAFGDVFVGIGEALQRLGLYPGHKAFDPGGSFGEIVRAAEVALGSRREGPVRDLGPVVEVVGDQWAVTEHGLECLTHRYTLQGQQLRADDQSSRTHVLEKKWVNADDFDDAFGVACAYHARKQEESRRVYGESPF